MSRTIRLEQLVIERPCEEAWEGMRGDDRRRFCSRCQKHVHDLGAMPRGEAEALVSRAEGPLCVRLPSPERRRVSPWRRAGRVMVAPLLCSALLAMLFVGFVRGLHEGSALHAAYVRVKAMITTTPVTPMRGRPVIMGVIMAAPANTPPDPL